MVKTKTQIKHDLRLAFIFLLIGIVGTSVIWVYASPSLSTFYISGGKYPSGLSYTIWKEGSSYCAKNGYGAIPSWGNENSNFTDVWQNSVNYGKRVFITAGIYYQDSQLNIGKFVEIEGEGKNQTIIRATTPNITMIYIANSSQAGNEMRGVTLRDLNIDGNENAENGIMGINCTMNNTFERLTIHRVWGTGFYLEDSWDNTIQDLWIYNIGGADHGYGAGTGTGFFLNRSGECVLSNLNFISSTADSYCALRVRRGFGLSIIGCTMSKWGDYGLYMTGSRGCGIYSSLLEQNLVNAIYITADAGFHSMSIGVHDCHLKSAETSAIVKVNGYYVSFTGNFFDIDRGSGGKHWEVSGGAGNSFDWTNQYLRQSSGVAPVYTDSGSRTKLIADRNMGTATGSSPIDVEHGLWGEPTYVTLGVKGATTYQTSWDTLNSTHFRIYHSGGGSITVTWYAEYKP